MSELFIVLQEGVYIQAFGGVFTSQEKAEAAAIEYAQSDVDSHHDYCVYPITAIDSVYPRRGDEFSRYVDCPASDAGAVASYNKAKVEKTPTARC